MFSVSSSVVVTPAAVNELEAVILYLSTLITLISYLIMKNFVSMEKN